jgi:hypothetical protein
MTAARKPLTTAAWRMSSTSRPRSRGWIGYNVLDSPMRDE